ncbi:hypothetical protein J5N97_007610 [Dioscorea zingiberensis]|uniref:Uncharacterized protein n=1 Tax=Dioscorea zingiberensis TaxID=325984 RepID=A0A9D5HUE6_9LILI|nr:hypothetical protein J5N97_007610 [Dioscorea zingiberensis]
MGVNLNILEYGMVMDVQSSIEPSHSAIASITNMEANKRTVGQGGNAGGADQVKGGVDSSRQQGSGGGHGDDQIMKAPGAEGHIKRQDFEKDPQAYFQGLRHGSDKPGN